MATATRVQYEVLQVIQRLEKKGSAWEPKGRQVLTARALLNRDWIYAVAEGGAVKYLLTFSGSKVANTYR